MAMNPMQRKAQNSFLLGMLITLLITGIIIVFLFMQLTKTSKSLQELQGNRVKICTLNTYVKSGQIITDDMVEVIEVDKNTIPSNSFGSDIASLANYRLEDVDGNDVVEHEGNTCIEVVEDNGNKKLIVVQEIGENYYKLIYNNSYVLVNENGETYIEISGIDSVTQMPAYKNVVLQKNDIDNYYYYINESNQEVKVTIKTEEVKFTTAPIVAKVAMEPNTVITDTIVVKSDEKITDDLRRQEYSTILLPTQIETGEYIDIRLRLPDGTDYIVMSHKEIEIVNIDGNDSLTNFWLNLNETEILTMSCAIVQSYQIPGSILYANTYVEAGLQDAATPTYLPSDSVVNLIAQDPNCVTEAKNALIKRFNAAKEKGNSSERNPIDNALNQNSGDLVDNAINGMEEEIDRMQEERQKYLDSLGGNY